MAGREPVLIHPGDALKRGIEEGMLVRVYNDRGACLAGAKLANEVRPGVVVMATGAWFDPVYSEGNQIELERSGNPNMMTLDKGTSRLAQASSAQTALVEVERYTGAAPEVETYQLPKIRPYAQQGDT